MLQWENRYTDCGVILCACPAFLMDGIELEEVKQEKDLGIWMEDSMKPAAQCEYAAKKGFAALGMISRAFHYRSKSTLLPLYKTFVRPKLEYAVAAWAPWTEKDKGVLEAVQ